jgi:hypothetical protein
VFSEPPDQKSRKPYGDFFQSDQIILTQDGVPSFGFALPSPCETQRSKLSLSRFLRRGGGQGIVLSEHFEVKYFVHRLFFCIAFGFLQIIRQQKQKK